MHMGGNEKASKTECIMFPAPGALTQEFIEGENNSSAPPLVENPSPSTSQTNHPIPGNTSPEAESSSSELKESLPKNKKKSKQKKLYRQSAKDIREDVVDKRHPETQRVDLDDGYVEFTKHFPYLGSFISYNLKDNFDISKRISKTFQNMGMLKHVWEDPHLNLYSKYLFFVAMPLNLLLWGCKSWALKKTFIQQFERFSTSIHPPHHWNQHNAGKRRENIK